MQILCKCVYECVMHLSTTISLFTFALLALLRRCYQCRSRGELGSCKDPFSFNATDVEMEPGVSAIPCASGWCGKVIEGGGTYALDGKKLRWLIYAYPHSHHSPYPHPDYDLALQRMCVQRGPDDNMDRCADTIYNHKKVFMCFCQGDLCNAAIGHHRPILVPIVASLMPIFLAKLYL